MIKNMFGATGLHISPLGFGAAPVGYLETPQEQTTELLNALLDNGLNLIDTAAGYRGSEEAIGIAISHRRDEFVLVSKCGYALPDLSGADWSHDLIMRTIDQSLRRLRTDIIDVMLLHSCPLDVLERGEAIGALVEAKQAGKIRFAGYSGDNEAAAFAASHPDISVLQTSINICDQRNIDHVLPIARQRNVGVMAKRPIANAAWKPLQQQPGMYADYARTYTERLTAMNITPQTAGIDLDWPSFALRFVLSQEGVHTAIIGTTRMEHAQANIKAVEEGPLPDSVVDKVRAAFRNAEQAAGETWLGQT